MKDWVKSKEVVLLSVFAVLVPAFPLLADQSLPPPPAGFTVVPLEPSAQAIVDTDQGDLISAEMERDASLDAGSRTSLNYGWQVPPIGFKKTWEVLKASPEEPASLNNNTGISDEPAGKRPYKNGILEWRRVTRAMAPRSDKRVTYRGLWMSYASGKLFVIRVENAASKEAGQAWIDGYLDRVIAVGGSAVAKLRTPKSVTVYIPPDFVVDDQTTVTQYLGAYNVTIVEAHRPNQLPKPFVSPEEANLKLVYTKIIELSAAPQLWQQAQKEAEGEADDQSDSSRTFLKKETLGSGRTIYWYRLDPLTYLPRRLRLAQGTKPSVDIYDATILWRLDAAILTIKITEYVGNRETLRQWYGRN